jgi:hypothetical protein
VVGQACAAKVGFFQLSLLDHGAHGSVEHQHLFV